MSLEHKKFDENYDRLLLEHFKQGVPPILDNLLQHKTRLGPLLLILRDRKFGDYLRDLIQTTETNNEIVQSDRKIVADCMRHQLEGRYPLQIIEKIAVQQSHYPLMQTADHSQLIYDPATFLNNFIFHSAIKQAGLEYAVVQQCSTVRMLTTNSPKSGPGVLTLNDELYRVFDTSNRKLVSSNVATLRNPRYLLEPMGTTKNQKIPQVLHELRGLQFPDAATAFREANNKIWSAIGSKDKRELVLFDEYLSSEIIPRMILTPNHILNNLLFDPEASGVFRDTIRDFVSSIDCLLLTDTTDFFWGRTRDQLSSMKLSSQRDVLQTDKSSKGVQIEFSPESVAYNLMNKNIYPNLLLSMVAVSILPQTTAVGGSSQFEYIPEIQEILSRTLAKVNLVPGEYIKTITENFLSTMLSHLLPTTHPIFNELAALDYGNDILRFGEDLQNTSLAELMEDYSGFSYFSKLFERRDSRKKSN